MSTITINGVTFNKEEIDGIRIEGDDTVYMLSKSSGGSAVEGGYTVTFMDGDEVYTVISVQAGASINSLSTNPDSDSSGSAFIGWSTVSGSEDDIISLPFTPTGDTTLYAVYGLSATLNDNPWVVVSNAAASGKASSYWSVGDLHSITLSGTVGTLSVSGTYYVYILGFNHNSTYEGDNLIHFGGFKSSLTASVDICLTDSGYNTAYYSGAKYFNMNHWGSSSSPYNTNYGGWKGCDLRYDVLGSTDVAPFGYGSTATTSRVGYDATSTCATSPVSGTLMASIESGLRAVMKPITKYTDNTGNATNTLACVSASVDYLPLLAEYEIFGARTYANSYEYTYQKQYDYYANGNSKIKYQHSATTTAASWWERSPCYNAAITFCFVNTNGGASGSISRFSIGLAPAFAV